MSDVPIELTVPDEPAIHVTTGRGEVYHFRDGGEMPEMSSLAAAVLVTRLRWWADEIDGQHPHSRDANGECPHGCLIRPALGPS